MKKKKTKKMKRNIYEGLKFVPKDVLLQIGQMAGKVRGYVPNCHPEAKIYLIHPPGTHGKNPKSICSECHNVCHPIKDDKNIVAGRRREMDEAYTCICGGQKFFINEDENISCGNCGRIHYLMWLDDEMEAPEDFNKRIRIDHCLEYVRKEGEK